MVSPVTRTHRATAPIVWLFSGLKSHIDYVEISEFDCGQVTKSEMTLDFLSAKADRTSWLTFHKIIISPSIKVISPL